MVGCVAFWRTDSIGHGALEKQRTPLVPRCTCRTVLTESCELKRQTPQRRQVWLSGFYSHPFVPRTACPKVRRQIYRILALFHDPPLTDLDKFNDISLFLLWLSKCLAFVQCGR